MTNRAHDRIRETVRKHYASIAASSNKDCACPGTSCCSAVSERLKAYASQLGYSKNDLHAVPDGSMTLGCGNPQAVAQIKKGEVVLDLGSGGGFDCFVAARQVGPKGKVIGVDMTPEMIASARENARKGGFRNVEFRLGEIEHLPVADENVDVIISNCVINLSPDKEQVYRDAFRVLKPGGRLAISDVVAIRPLPSAIRNDLRMHAGCAAGALPVKKLERILQSAGFCNITVRIREESKAFIKQWFPGSGIDNYLRSADIEGTKPKGNKE